MWFYITVEIQIELVTFANVVSLLISHETCFETRDNTQNSMLPSAHLFQQTSTPFTPQKMCIPPLISPKGLVELKNSNLKW